LKKWIFVLNPLRVWSIPPSANEGALYFPLYFVIYPDRIIKKDCKLFILKILEMIDIKNEIFKPVAERIRERASSLSEIHRFHCCGIEGWLKVEAIKALSGMVKSVNNRGPDITLTDGTQIELKGATNFDAASIRRGCLKDDAPCLFLADGSNPKKVKNIENEKVEVKASQIISDGPNNWMVGLAAPLNPVEG